MSGWLLLAFAFAFPRGAAFLDLGCRAGDELCGSAAACRNCHAREYEAWSASRHRTSWTNDLFQEGFRSEPMRACAHCHAPLGTGEARAHEGVSCAVCHVRGGVVAAAKELGYALHRTETTPELKDPAFCGGCHEFAWIGSVDVDGSMQQAPMQTTLSEWRTYAAAGGRGTCQSCHMPNGDHGFRRSYGSLAVETTKARAAVRFRLRSVDVGHDLPTGDVFRRLTFEVAAAGSERFEVVERIGKEFALRVDHDTGTTRRELIADTTLKPGLDREVAGSFRLPARWRVVYHEASERSTVGKSRVVSAGRVSW